MLYATSHQKHYRNCVNQTYQKLYPATVGYQTISKELYLTGVLSNLCQHTLHGHHDPFELNGPTDFSYTVMGEIRLIENRSLMIGSIDNDSHKRSVSLMTAKSDTKSLATFLSLDFSK